MFSSKNIKKIPHDNAVYVDLIKKELARGKISYQTKAVATEEAFVYELFKFLPDLILAEYNLHTWDGYSALKITRENGPEPPFIFVSETMG